MLNNPSTAHHPINALGPLQTATSNLVIMATNVNDNSKQIINNLAREMMESTGLHTTDTASILQQANMSNANLIVNPEYVDQSYLIFLSQYLTKSSCLYVSILLREVS
jgi:hypothetical protein